MKSKVVAEALTMLVTAFGLVAALAWNEAVKALILELLPRGQGVLPLFIYAILVTLLAAFVTTRLIKIKDKISGEQQ